VIAELIAAEGRGRELFAEVLARKLIIPGKTESQLSEDVRDLASEMFGVKKYWHKRIVRAGANTQLPYAGNPPDHTLLDDDIMYFDFGPVFDGDWEADLGFTYVLGADPKKHALAAGVASGWNHAAEYFRERTNITCSELYKFCSDFAVQRGWAFGHIHCGHRIGAFPDEQDDERITANNHQIMRRVVAGQPLVWILEIHFVDREAGYGGFQEALLLD
jgi:Xaa-Pro dipeptidase